MPDLKEITVLPVEEELHACPLCGYRLGFHVSFIRAIRENTGTAARELFRVILICPECGARYDAGWRVSLNEFEDKTGCVPHGSPAACLPHDLHDR